jgi:hypothetical protein
VKLEPCGELQVPQRHVVRLRAVNQSRGSVCCVEVFVLAMAKTDRTVRVVGESEGRSHPFGAVIRDHFTLGARDRVAGHTERLSIRLT